MVLAFLVILSGFLLTAQNIFAVSVDISNVPSTISDQPFNIDVSITGAQARTNHIRANLFPTGTTNNYFGYTYSGSSFVNSSNYSDYLPVTIDSTGNWSGTIQAKLDSSSNYYTGPGSYSLKVRRYTQSGLSYTWSNELTVNINTQLTPTLTPTPTPPISPTPTTQSSSFTISNVPSSINSNQTFSVSVDLNLPSNPSTIFYLKGAFKKSDNSNYFGLTKVGSNWIKNGNTYSDQLSITTDSFGYWSGSLEVQPDSSDSGFEGSGQYIFKVGRYSQSGSGPTWSNETTITINQVSSPTTSPSSTPVPTATVKPSPTSISKTTTNLKNSLATVAGLKKESTPSSASITPNPSNLPNLPNPSNSKFTFLPFIGAGFLLIGSSAVYIYRKQKLQFKK